MNLKIFSIIVGILIAVIVILGGTYYYLLNIQNQRITP
nr:hypothetical protein QZ67_00843 [Campylobacter jejuni subsp. jejuni]